LGQRLSLAALVWNGVRLYAGGELAALLEQVTKLWDENIEREEGERPPDEVVRELERRALASAMTDVRLIVQIQVFERGGRCDIETKSAWIKSPE
jgi:hypothetical protein